MNKPCFIFVKNGNLILAILRLMRLDAITGWLVDHYVKMLMSIACPYQYVCMRVRADDKRVCFFALDIESAVW